MTLRLATIIVSLLDFVAWVFIVFATFLSESDQATKGLDNVAGMALTACSCDRRTRSRARPEEPRPQNRADIGACFPRYIRCPVHRVGRSIQMNGRELSLPALWIGRRVMSASGTKWAIQSFPRLSAIGVTADKYERRP